MADFDYVKVVGRLGITRADGPDELGQPDTVWCDSGTVRFEPLVKTTKVVDGVPSPWTAGHSVIDAPVNSEGYVSLNGLPEVWLVDLGSDSVRPKIERNRASYKVTFMDIRAQGAPVSFGSFTCHPLPVTLLPEGVTANDITLMSPLLSPSGQLIMPGPTGTAVVGLNIVNDHLIATLSDGTEVDAGLLPDGPAGPANTLTIGTVEPGPAAGATITGASPNQQLSLVLPTPSVAVGTVGAVPNGTTPTVTNSGTPEALVLDFEFPEGPTGQQGSAGTVDVGTVTTVEFDIPADVNNIGTLQAAILDFSIPRGKQGEPGVNGVDPHPIAVGEYPSLNPASFGNDTIFIEWTN